MGVVAPIAATGVVVPVAIGLVGGDRPAAAAAGRGRARHRRGGARERARSSAACEAGQARGGARSLLLALGAAVGFGLVLWLLAKGGHYSVTMTLVTQRSASLVDRRGAGPDDPQHRRADPARRPAAGA